MFNVNVNCKYKGRIKIYTGQRNYPLGFIWGGVGGGVTVVVFLDVMDISNMSKYTFKQSVSNMKYEVIIPLLLSRFVLKSVLPTYLASNNSLDQ